MSSMSKLAMRQPVQELAFHKQQWEINGVQFQCHESSYEGELLNGVDLRIKQVRGMRNGPRLYDYLQDSQELVFCASSHIMVYNTHKRTYHQLFPLKGKLQLLRAHIEKMNNREYIIWVESFPSELDVHTTKPRTRPQTRNSKKVPAARPVKRNAFLKSLFSGEGDQHVLERQYFLLKVFDYTRKQFVFEGPLSVGRDHAIRDVFLFWNHYKIVGYVAEEYESNLRFVYYQNVEIKAKGQTELFGLATDLFTKLETQKQLESLVFNSQLNNYAFAHSCTLNQLCIREEAKEGDHELFRQFLSLGQGKASENKPKGLRLQVQEVMTMSGQVLALALNDQYLAVLTASKVAFHSAYDISSVIFVHQFDISQVIPMGVEFSKASVLITHRGQPKVSTFMVKNKALRLACENKLEVSHCREILKVYTNNISSEVFCVSVFDELPGRQYMGASLSGALLQGLVEYVARPASVDVVATFLTPARPEAITLGLAQRKFRKLHTCPWLSAYFVETEEGIQYGKWQETFENKRCVALHPTGLFLVVCLRDSFKVYIVTSQGFTNTYRGDSMKDIQAVAISSAGNHLAIASTNAIFLYDFYSCSKVKTITLPFGPIIQSLEYFNQILVCQLRNRKVYLYDSPNEYKQIMVFNPKSCLGQGRQEQQFFLGPLHYDPILNFLIYSHGSTVFFYNCATQSLQTTVQLEPLSRIYYCQSLATLFFGTEGGELFCFAWPNKPNNLQGEQRKFRLHSGRIVDICVSADLREIVTMGEDESLCVSSLVLVQNLKRFQGLQLVEHLAPSIRIGYDFLSRRGLHQYTHSKFTEKANLLKDCQDEVLNMHFILPEERQKQKEQMFANVRTGLQNIAEDSNHLYTEINDSTNQARDVVARTRKGLNQFTKKSQIEREETKKTLYAKYIQQYNSTERSIEELQRLRTKCQEEAAAVKKEYQLQFERYMGECKQKYDDHLKEQEIQVRGMKQVEWAELGEIDQEKRLFIDQNIKALDGVLADLNGNNGILACKNNNLQKEIAQIKRKIEEQRYLVQRLEGSTARLREEQLHYGELKAENKLVVERQDRVNLTEIEKRYVKQTQALIEKDKEINVQLVNHQKEKSILIHLEKCLEQIEGNIQQLVSNILKEKQDRKEETVRIQQIRASSRALLADAITRKKEKVNSRNLFYNYVCQLEAIIEEILHAGSHQNIKKILQQRGLIQPNATTEGQGQNRENQMLNKIISQKVHNINGESRAGARLLKGRYRTLKTQGGQANSSKALLGKDYSVTSRELVDRRAKEVYMKLDSQQKHYERIKTEQLVFQNTRKKFNLQNQDLIENYNSLAMENKKALASLRHQESLGRLPNHRQRKMGKDECSPTPFQLYLLNKANTNRTVRIPIPAKTFQY